MPRLKHRKTPIAPGAEPLFRVLAAIDGECTAIGSEALSSDHLRNLLADAGYVIVPAAINRVDRRPLLDVSQVLAALGLLRWSSETLAQSTGLSTKTLGRILYRGDPLRGTTAAKVRAALEKAGVSFVIGAKGELGVMLRSDI